MAWLSAGAESRTNRHAGTTLRFAAWLLLLLAATILLLAPPLFFFRAGAMLFVLLALELGRRSGAPPVLLTEADADARGPSRPTSILMGTAMLAAGVASSWWLYVDARHGNEHLAPEIVFALAGLANAVWWAGAVARFIGGR
jgi:hypothetical protein